MEEKHIIILIHGIRTSAAWQGKVKRGIEDFAADHPSAGPVEIRALGYGFFDAFRFLVPLSFIRNRPAMEIYSQIKAIRANNPTARISVVCHSFGTFVIGKILLDQFEVRFERIVLVGSVLPRTYPWFVFSRERVRDVLNEVGTRDVWPLMAKACTWGYGIAGWLGFRQGAVVKDRYWHSDHGALLNQDHARKNWAPFLLMGEISNDGEGDEDRPYWTQLLSMGVLKYVLLFASMVLLSSMIEVPVSHEVQVRVPVDAGLHEEVPSATHFTASNADMRGLFQMPPQSEVRFARAETLRWGLDRLENIETILAHGPFLVDMSAFLAGWEESGKEKAAFVKWLTEQHEQRVVEAKLGSSRQSLPQSPLLQEALSALVNAELIPVLKDPSKLVDGKYLKVDCSQGGNLFDPRVHVNAARRSFYKRVVGLGFVEPPANEAFGPYFGASGLADVASGPNFRPPDRDSPRGCLVAMVYGCSPNQQPSVPAVASPFFAPHHAIKNPSEAPLFVRFMMNDDIAEDNGDGRCDVTIVVHRKTSILKWMFSMLESN